MRAHLRPGPPDPEGPRNEFASQLAEDPRMLAFHLAFWKMVTSHLAAERTD